MKTYLITLVSASLFATLVGILSPSGDKGGISKHMKLLTSLFLVCVLISPLQDAIKGLHTILDGSAELPWLEESQDENLYEQEMNEALEGASTSYFTQMLTQMLETQFAIATGDVRCQVQWKTENETLTPVRVTVILSGRAIWKDPQKIENFVSELLGCECVSAIE